MENVEPDWSTVRHSPRVFDETQDLTMALRPREASSSSSLSDGLGPPVCGSTSLQDQGSLADIRLRGALAGGAASFSSSSSRGQGHSVDISAISPSSSNRLS